MALRGKELFSNEGVGSHPSLPFFLGGGTPCYPSETCLEGKLFTVQSFTLGSKTAF